MKFKDLIDKVKGSEIQKNDTLAKPEEFTTEKSINKDVNIPGDGKLTGKFGGSFGGSLSLINSADESEKINDPEGVFMKPKYANADMQKLLKPEPVIALSNNHGYLRYSLGMNLGVSGNGSYSFVGIDFDAQANWSTSYYSKHPFLKDGNAVMLGEAIAEDLGFDLDSLTHEDTSPIKGIVSLFDSDPAGAVDQGDVLTFAAAGSLGGSISLSASDLLAGSVSATGLFKEAIPITYKAGATIKASVKFEGDFFLAVAGLGANELSIVIRRSSSKLSGFSAGLNVVVEVDLTETVDLINGYLALITELPKTKLKQLRGQVANLLASGVSGINGFVDDLGVNEYSILSDLYDKFIEDTLGELESWIAEKSEKILAPLEQLEDFLDDWADTLKSHSKQKIGASFGYQASKLDASSDLLRFTCNNATFTEFRSELLTFQINVDALNKHPSVNIKRFLNAKLQETTSQVGLMLNIGGWSFGSSVGASESWVMLKDYKNDGAIIRATFVGGRWYEAKDFKDGKRYNLSIEATSNKDADVIAGRPQLKDMDYLFGVSTTFNEDKLEPRNLEQFIDYGVVYGSIQDAGTSKTMNQLTDAGLEFGKASDVEVGLVVSKTITPLIISYIAKATNEDFARALSVAMLPWDNVEGRNTLSERLEIYKPVWEHILTTGDHSYGAKQILDAKLEENGFDKLAKWEGLQWQRKQTSNDRGPQSPKIQSFAGIVLKHSRFIKTVRHLRTGFQSLQGHLESSTLTDYKQFELVYDDIQKGWDFSYSSRWIAALLNQAANSTELSKYIKSGEIEYTFKIKQGTKVINIPKA
jgi:hypothetical protein